MPLFRSIALGPLDLVGAALSQPLISLAIALVISFGIVLVTSGLRKSHSLPRAVAASIRSRYRSESVVLGLAALGVIVIFATEALLRGYAFGSVDTVAWWRFATPLLTAVVGTGIALAAILTRGARPPESPVMPAMRRTWLSFGPQWGLVAGAVTLLVLTATTLTAGFASSPNGEGRYVWLVIPIPNETEIDPIRVPFYGWTYGVPVLVCLAALTVTSWAALRINALRPYIRPETLTAEGHARRGVATAIVSIATGAMLLTLAGSWRLIANAGSVSTLIIDGQNSNDPYDTAWRYAEFAALAGRCAPLLEITAFALLLLVAANTLRKDKSQEPATQLHDADAEAVR